MLNAPGGTGATIDRILDKTGMSGIRAYAVRLEGAVTGSSYCREMRSFR
jgi:hypothetical protein